MASLLGQLVKNPSAMLEIPVQFLGREDSPGEGIGYPLKYSWASLVTQMVKSPLAMQETWVRSLGWEDPREEEMTTLSSILAWRIPMDRGAWQVTVHGVAESGMTKRLSTSTHKIFLICCFSDFSSSIAKKVGNVNGQFHLMNIH